MRFDKTFPKWARKLTFGDTVRDCRFKHLKIKNIGFEEVPIVNISRFFYSKWVPYSISDFLVSNYEEICDRLRLVKVWDIHVELSDGASCSIRNCCSDPAAYPDAPNML